MLRWKLLLLAVAVTALAPNAKAQRVNFQSPGPQIQSFHNQPVFSRPIMRPPALNFSTQRSFIASPRHFTPLPLPSAAPAGGPPNPSSILQPQPPTRFIFLNPFASFYTFFPDGSYRPWMYSQPGYLPYANPYADQYGSLSNGYSGYPEQWNNYSLPYSSLPNPSAQSSAPPMTTRTARRAHLMSPAQAAQSQPPLPSQVSVTLDGNPQLGPAFTHPLIVGSGQHTIVIGPRRAPAGR